MTMYNKRPMGHNTHLSSITITLIISFMPSLAHHLSNLAQKIFIKKTSSNFLYILPLYLKSTPHKDASTNVRAFLKKKNGFLEDFKKLKIQQVYNNSLASPFERGHGLSFLQTLIRFPKDVLC